MRRRGRPSLMGTAARTAVVVGTANAVTRKGNERAAESQDAAAFRAQQHAPAPVAAPVAAPPPVQSASAGVVQHLEDLSRLRDAGVLSAEEFTSAKTRLLSSF